MSIRQYAGVFVALFLTFMYLKPSRLVITIILSALGTWVVSML